MKRIGLLGGTAWPSTIEYYRLLNEMVQRRYGEDHSAEVLLWSMDFFHIRQYLPDQWTQINSILQSELERFSHLEPACILICNNTLHQGYDMFSHLLKVDVPVFHIVDIVLQHLKAKKVKRVLLTGTKHTMECGYYKNKIENEGIDVVIPNHDDRLAIDSLQKKIARGEDAKSFCKEFSSILANYNQCDTVLTACTELPLAIEEQCSFMHVVDPTRLQCEAAFKFANDDVGV